MLNGSPTYVPNSFNVTNIFDVLGGVTSAPASVVAVTAFEIIDTLPTASVVFIANVYCVVGLRLSTVIAPVGGEGSPEACDAAAQSPSTNVVPTLYLTS
jgi:hypothetical protein